MQMWKIFSRLLCVMQNATVLYCMIVFWCIILNWNVLYDLYCMIVLYGCTVMDDIITAIFPDARLIPTQRWVNCKHDRKMHIQKIFFNFFALKKIRDWSPHITKVNCKHHRILLKLNTWNNNNFFSHYFPPIREWFPTQRGVNYKYRDRNSGILPKWK